MRNIASVITPSLLLRFICAVLLFCSSFIVGSVMATSANSIVVNSNSDIGKRGDGDCSLREAIDNANSRGDTTRGDCEAGTGTDAISFSHSGAIRLQSGLPAIANTLAINGGGIVITGDTFRSSKFQLLQVRTGATLALAHLTLSNNPGQADFTDRPVNGGAIYNDGTLSVSNCTLSENFAFGGGALFNDMNGTATIDHTTLSDNHADQGGALYNRNRITVTNSTFMGNVSDVDGGAAYNDLAKSPGALTIERSTFSHNESDSFGGAITSSGSLTIADSTFSANAATDFHGLGSGGALDLLCPSPGCSGPSSATITNSTFSGNSAALNGGAIENLEHGLTCVNCTFTGNLAMNKGGGIYNDSTSTTFHNTLFAKSTNGNCFNNHPASGNFNISDDQTCGFDTVADPLLDPNGLKDNGGPTQTIALQSLSPAIDQVPMANCPATDQRGYLRLPVGKHVCDIGAFDLDAVPPSISATPMPTPTPALVDAKLVLNTRRASFGHSLRGDDGQPGASRRIIVTNTSRSENVLIERIEVTGANPDDFVITSPNVSSENARGSTSVTSCSTALPSKGKCDITIQFTAGGHGSRTAILTVTGNNANGAQTVNLIGTGTRAKLQIVPQALRFSSQPLNTSSPAKTITLSNNTAVDVTISSVSSSDPAQFPASGCVETLQKGGGHCDISVTYTPDSAGPHRATLTIIDNAYKSPQIVTLNGTK